MIGLVILAANSNSRSVIVIGAGFAGLASASVLIEKGFDVTVLEAQPQAGGRIVSRSIEGFQIDLGANFFLESDAAAHQFANRLGVPLKRTPVPIHSGIYRNGRFHGLYGDSSLPSLLKTARTMLSFRLLSPKGLWQAGKLSKMLRSRQNDFNSEDYTRLLDLDTSHSAAEFIDANFGNEALEWLFGPGLSGYTFAHPEQLGTAFAMATIWHNGISDASWPCLPDGGMRVFGDALASSCQSCIRLSTPAQRIEIENGTAKGIVIDSGFLRADAVICATTATAAVEVAPDLPLPVRKALNLVRYSKCCRVFFGSDSSPFPRGWYAVGFPRKIGAKITGMSIPSLLAPETVPNGKSLIDVLAIDKQAESLFELNDKQIQEHALAQILSHFPGMPHKEPLWAFVQRWPQALSLSPPGTLTAMHRLQHENLNEVDRLFFAGDYLGMPSANTALRSGLDAAAAVVKRLR